MKTENVELQNVGKSCVSVCHLIPTRIDDDLESGKDHLDLNKDKLFDRFFAAKSDPGSKYPVNGFLRNKSSPKTSFFVPDVSVV